MVEGVLSSLLPVLSGVPQCTVMAPVIFLLMIADIARGVTVPPSNPSMPEPASSLIPSPQHTHMHLKARPTLPLLQRNTNRREATST